MCSIYGFLRYKNCLGDKTLTKLLKQLAIEGEIRGTDATGYAYVENGNVRITKAPVKASKLHFEFPANTVAVIGHTRFTTQGNEKNNWNNHPFDGCCGDEQFALAHNGCLYNDKSLRKELKLPPTCIETDSYIAVQLLERNKQLDIANVKSMAETISGSFMLTILKNDNSIYLAKGSNPITIYHFPTVGLYVYASTTTMIDGALKKTKLDKMQHEEIAMTEEDIVVIKPDGTTERDTFKENYSGYRSKYNYSYFDDYSYSRSVDSWGGKVNSTSYTYNTGDLVMVKSHYDDEWNVARFLYPTYGGCIAAEILAGETESKAKFYPYIKSYKGKTVYEQDLYDIAKMMGVSNSDVDLLLEFGYDETTVEDLLYTQDALYDALKEIKDYAMLGAEV